MGVLNQLSRSREAVPPPTAGWALLSPVGRSLLTGGNPGRELPPTLAEAQEASLCDAAAASIMFPFQAEQTCVNTLLKLKKNAWSESCSPLIDFSKAPLTTSATDVCKMIGCKVGLIHKSNKMLLIDWTDELAEGGIIWSVLIGNALKKCNDSGETESY